MRGEHTSKGQWAEIVAGEGGDNRVERSLFVPEGQEPTTQRQLNLYHYFLFIKDILGRRRVRDVLEVGAGRGTISLYLATRLGCRVTLLDNVADALAIAREDFTRHGKDAAFFVEDVLHSHFPGASFDAIVSIGLAEHFPPEDVERLFSEQYRLLRPGGVMLSLNIPKKFSIQSLNTVMRFFKKLTSRYREELKKDYFRNELTPAAYGRIARRAGFKNILITHVCPFPLFVPVARTTDRTLATFYKFILALRAPFMRYPYKTNRLLAQAHFLVASKP